MKTLFGRKRYAAHTAPPGEGSLGRIPHVADIQLDADLNGQFGSGHSSVFSLIGKIAALYGYYYIA